MDNVPHISVFEVYWYGITLSADPNRNTLKDRLLEHRAEFDLTSSVTAWKAKHLAASGIDENTIGIVLYKPLVDLFEGPGAFGWTFVESNSTKPLSNLRFCFPIHPNDRDGTPFLYSRQMDVCVLAHDPGQIT